MARALPVQAGTGKMPVPQDKCDTMDTGKGACYESDTRTRDRPIDPDAGRGHPGWRDAVPLDTVIYAFRDGATAEAIVDRYPSLTLADVYASIAYYLRHTAELDSYLTEQERISAEIRSENERRFPPEGVRARLLARRTLG